MSSFANRAFARIVPVVGSIWLSSVRNVPCPSTDVRVRSSTVAGNVAPAPTRCWIFVTVSAGNVNTTSIGVTVVIVAMPTAPVVAT